jgi:hypothetical protein
MEWPTPTYLVDRLPIQLNLNEYDCDMIVVVPALAPNASNRWCPEVMRRDRQER